MLLFGKKSEQMSYETEDLKDVIDQMVVEIKNIEDPFADKLNPEQVRQRLKESLNDREMISL